MAVAVQPVPGNPSISKKREARMDVDLEDETDEALDLLMTKVDESVFDRADSTSPMVMLAFYKRLFPYKQIFQWLNLDQAPTRNWTHREFAFTLANDAYLRYNSFADVEAFKKEVCRLNPARFEVGPVYSAKPKDRKTLRKQAFKPVCRELVFDIDMTDYDDVRTCCSGKDLCKRCWKYIAVAVQVVDEALREDFGFRQILWVYSGRRGIHCWVSDSAARELTDDQRKALVGFLEVVKGSANMTKKVDLGRSVGGHRRLLHPSLERAKESLKEAFVDIVIQDQDCFREKEQWEKLLQLLPEREVVNKLRRKWESAPEMSSCARWDDIRSAAAKLDKPGQNSMRSAMEDIMLQYTYPRIDAEVSKHLNHLLKSPFCVHPATGRVCVPVDPAQVTSFDPTTVPTVAQLLRELNEAAATDKQGLGGAGGRSKDADWQKTSLKPYVELLESQAQALLRETRELRRAAEAQSMEF